MTAHPAVPLAVAEPARRRLGIFTSADLAARGVSEREVRTAVRSGTWVRLRTGIFVTAVDLAEIERTGRRPGLDALAVTTSLDRPSAVMSGATAAWIWGLPRPTSDPPIVHLTDPHRWRRGRGWIMTHAGLPDDEVTTRGAYRVTTAARTVVDLARAWPEVHAVAAADAALLRRLTSREELGRVLDRQASVPGIPRAVRAVALADGRAESWLETWGRLTFAALGLPPFTPQVELWADGQLLKVAGRLVSPMPPWRSNSTAGSSTAGHSSGGPRRTSCGRRSASRTCSAPSACGSSASPPRT